MIRTGLPLLRISRATEEAYRAHGRGGSKATPPRNRVSHATQLLQSLDSVDQAVRASKKRAPKSQGHLVTAVGELGDDARRLGDRRSDAVLVAVDDGQAMVHFRTNTRALRKKVVQYRDKDTRKGVPANEPLVARINDVRLTTLTDLSLGELSDQLIDPAERYWVELWTRGGRTESAAVRARVQEEVRWLAQQGGHSGDPTRFAGAERDIFLVRLAGGLLVELPGLVPEIYEVHLAPRVRLVQALLQGEAEAGPSVAVEAPPAGAAFVAVHDTGVSARHPYLQSVLQGTASVVPGELGAIDRHGHGTSMAGIAVYPDYLQGIAQGRLHPQNRLVGVRLIPTPRQGPQGDDPELWAARTENAFIEAERIADDGTVVHSLSIGAENEHGRRTAWSVGLDKLAWNGGSGRLVVVAAGNVPTERLATESDNYPSINLGTPMCQPAQAWNVLTVGGYTALTEPPIGISSYPAPLAPKGGLSPYSSTDHGGSGRPIKPDIVKEAGNTAPGGGLPNSGAEHLSLWTTSHEHQRGRLSTQTYATSPAAASAAADLAILARWHPNLSKSAIRALYVHTARWTSAMQSQFRDRKDLLRAVGYGMPDLRAARGADSNRPVFVYEGRLTPSRGNAQFLQIPVPEQFLGDHAEDPVQLTVTLAYFIEPTETLTGRPYAGGRLAWEMQGPTENEQQLRRRINALARDSSDKGARTKGYSWTIGRKQRDRGTVQHDYVRVSAAELAGNRLLAVYPVQGWWRDRNPRIEMPIPYAIVVSIDFGAADVDLYAAIEASVRTAVHT